MHSKKVLESLPRAIRVIRLMTLAALDGTLTFHQTRVLYLITEGLGQSQIAEQLQVSPAAVCKLVHQLTEKGLITMVPGKDRRERRLALTKAGSKTLSSVSRQMQKKMNKGISALSAKEKDDLLKGLDVLDKLIIRIKEG